MIISHPCNSDNKIFEDSNVKKAISLALDREKISEFPFISYAKPAYTPFHPDYYRINEYDSAPLKYNVDVAKHSLQKPSWVNFSIINLTVNGNEP